jgi:methionine-gamma-lyase
MNQVRRGPVRPDIRSPESLAFATQAVHLGDDGERDARAVAGLESKLAALEGAESAVVLASGIAALHAVFFTFLQPGDHIVAAEVTGEATQRLITELLGERLGVKASFVDASRVSDVVAALRPNTKLVHVETIGDPALKVADIAAIAAVTHGNGALLSVESTLTPPPLYRPLADGADLVVHALTKYIAGQGDGQGGAVLGDGALIDELRAQALRDIGGVISPFDAWLTTRGSVTLPLRLERHLGSAQQVAEFLEDDQRVALVSYPGLRSHPQHAIATRQFGKRGHGAVLAFAVHGDAAAHRRLVAALRVVAASPSRGHDASLITYFPPEDPRSEAWPQPFRRHGLLRLSVGLEDPQDIIRDLAAALGEAFDPKDPL